MLFDKTKLEKIFYHLAKLSLDIKKNENVLVEAVNISEDILVLLIGQLKNVGANVFLNIKFDKVMREIVLYSNAEYFDTMKMMMPVDIRIIPPGIPVSLNHMDHAGFREHAECPVNRLEGYIR